MKSLYAITLCGALLLMHYVGKRAKGQNNPLAKALTQLMMLVFLTVVSSFAAAFVAKEKIALFSQSLHYASTEWLLIFLLRFMEQYAEDTWSNKRAKIIIYLIAVLNTGSMLLNNVFHHVVTGRYTNIGNGIMLNVFTTVKPWYNVHLCFSAFLVLGNVTVLISQSMNTTKFFRKKYFVALIMLICTVCLEILCSWMDYPLDFSLYVYIALTIFLTYYSVYYTPQGLITTTLSYAVENLSSGVVCFDMLGRCIYANDVAIQLYGNRKELQDLEPVFLEELGVSNFKEASNKKWDREFDLEGKRLYYGMNFGKLFDEENAYMGCYFFFHDKTGDVKRLEKEHYHSTHDMLTRLFNKEYFYKSVQKKQQETPEPDAYIVCTDVKDFKLINELYGVQMGDEILIRMARIMKSRLPKNTISARIGGDRFAFCVTKNLYNEGVLLAAIHEIAHVISTSEYQIVIHCGVYEIQKEDTDVSVMCDRGNMAIGMIKDSYECKVAYYDEQLMNRAMYEKHMVSEFDTALASGQFVMFLQPQVSCDGTVLGAEALVRWLHPERGMVPPGDFIEVFENSGLIHYLDQYIWEQAARKLKEWKETGHENLHISVNISAKDFYYLDVYKSFTKLVEKYDIPPEKLKLEITETAVMMDLEKQLVLLSKLQKYGFHVEIDDFGSGYSSLNMLKDICADVLKIDMGFLRETENRGRTRIILNTIIDLAKQLHMVVVTEGVENKEQVEYLAEAGCDMLQGYYFSKPIAVDEFEKRYL
jgi:diguanylate cyclase (GGDEF)-like protein